MRPLVVALGIAFAGRALASAGSTCEAPRLLFTVDRSTTMLERDDGERHTRWEIVRGAVNQIASESQALADLGLFELPETAYSCSAGGKLLVAPMRGAATAIAAALAANPPGPQLYTPVGQALGELADDPDTSGAVVLITDGGQSCPGAERPWTRDAIVAKARQLASRGVRLYVVSVPSPYLDATLLNQLAIAGGVATEGCDMDGGEWHPCYLPGEDIVAALRVVVAAERHLRGCACEPGDERRCGHVDVGECSSGVQRCVDGVWGDCEGDRGPQPETCDGLDNDCDGTPDPGCDCRAGEERPCGFPDVGSCREGTQTCGAHGWGECQSTIGPGREICDGLDNDCDGQVDESADQVCPLGHYCFQGKCSEMPTPPRVYDGGLGGGCAVGGGGSPWTVLIVALAAWRARRRGTPRRPRADRRRPCRAA